jgi:LysM repeat protein
MSKDQSTPPPSRPGRNDAWRHERMVQRVPAHLGEETGESVPPWAMIAGVALLLLIVCAVLFFLLGGTSRLGLGATSATATPRAGRTLTPGVIIIPVTLAPPPSPFPTPTIASVKYKVKAGDSLIEIAAKYKVSVQSIRIANNLKDDTIRVGDDLIIPLPTPSPGPISQLPVLGTPTPIALDSPPLAAADAATPGVIRHTVKRGDTLIGIAATYNSNANAIRIANQLDSDFLSIGQVLEIPPGDWTPTPTATPLIATTATATPQFPYAAPSLMFPTDQTIFTSKEISPTLGWISSGTLKSNEYYIVHIDYTIGNQKKSIVRQERSTSIRLRTEDFPGATPNGTTFSWYVVIVSQGPTRTPGATPPVLASSPESPHWTFAWR